VPALPGLAELGITAGFALVRGFGFAGTLQDLALAGSDLPGTLAGLTSVSKQLSCLPLRS
jgi:hypothetical protein